MARRRCVLNRVRTTRRKRRRGRSGKLDGASGAHDRWFFRRQCNRHVGAPAGAQLSEIWGQPVVIENRTGAGSLVANAMAA